ncbi:MAG: MBL fold metallo-hydrolase [Candidatus Nealsonbacteria bacterium]|nr:MBL fold metallo-hydrolase [Candidatus Nealsonbacteria bacterium]
MKIIWHGQSLFEITVSARQGEETKIVIDPFDESYGLKLPKLQADILLVSHEHKDHSNVGGVLGNYFLIENPGEYEAKGVYVKGIPAFHDSSSGKERGKITMFKILAEEIKICHLSDLGQKELTEQQLDEIGEVDILLIPVGGNYTIAAKEASMIISQIEPKIVIPMHYQIPKLKLKLEELDKFLKIMGSKNPEKLNKLTIRKKELSEDGMKIIVLEL